MTVLGFLLFFAGFFVAVGLLEPSAAPGGRLPVEFLWGTLVLFAGGIVIGLGWLFQKGTGDEWGPWGSLRSPPRSPQVECKHCSGLMNFESRICPYCGGHQ